MGREGYASPSSPRGSPLGGVEGGLNTERSNGMSGEAEGGCLLLSLALNLRRCLFMYS